MTKIQKSNEKHDGDDDDVARDHDDIKTCNDNHDDNAVDFDAHNKNKK